MVRAVVLLAGLVAVTPAARAEPLVRSQDAPRWKPSARPDSRALGGGLALFGVGYGGALVLGAQRDFADDNALLAVPVAGPWLTLWDGSDHNPWALTMDGVAQFGGAAVTTIALAYPVEVIGPSQGKTIPRVHVGVGAPGRPWSLSLNTTF